MANRNENSMPNDTKLPDAGLFLFCPFFGCRADDVGGEVSSDAGKKFRCLLSPQEIKKTMNHA